MTSQNQPSKPSQEPPPTPKLPSYLAPLQQPTPGTYLVVGKHCWGRGPTLAKALKNCRHSGGSGSVTKSCCAVLFTSKEDAEIMLDDFGRTLSDSPLQTLYRKGL